jgi:hypothetical protein
VRLEGVSPSYFTLFGVAPAAGTLRQESADVPGPEGAVALISTALWQRRFGGDSAILQRQIVLDGTAVRIAGVLPSGFHGLIGHTDVCRRRRSQHPVRSGRGSVQPDVYLPVAQVTWGSSVVFLRLSRNVVTTRHAIGAAIRDVDADVPVHQVAPLAQRLGAGFATERLLAQVLRVFALTALLLAAAGVYGVVAHAVAQGLREVGIRMALGASGGRIAAMMARRAAVIVSTGLSLGIAGATFAAASLSAFLFGVAPRDPGTLAAAAGLVAIASGALYLPLRRAAAVDPMAVLRQ